MFLSCDIIQAVIIMKKIGIVLLLVISLAGCTSKTQKQYSKTTLTAGFDTSITLLASADSQEEFDDYFQLMINEFTTYNKFFDKYNSYEGINNIKTINDQAGIEAVKVDPIIMEMMILSKEIYTVSDEFFDITMGAVLNIWHNYREDAINSNEFDPVGEVPTISELENASVNTGWQYVEIDETNNTIFITQKGVSIDVGGVAKGLATEKVAKTLEAAGLTSGIVNAGGNVKTIGMKNSTDGWKIGITLPTFAANKEIDTIQIPESMAFVTSGVYQRYYTGSDGKLYHHIINPKTLFPAEYFESVTVITKDSGLADALTKALFMKSYEDGVAFVQKYNQDHPNEKISVIWIAKDNATYSDWVLLDGYRIKMTDDLITYSTKYKAAVNQ